MYKYTYTCTYLCMFIVAWLAFVNRVTLQPNPKKEPPRQAPGQAARAPVHRLEGMEEPETSSHRVWKPFETIKQYLSLEGACVYIYIYTDILICTYACILLMYI